MRIVTARPSVWRAIGVVAVSAVRVQIAERSALPRVARDDGRLCRRLREQAFTPSVEAGPNGEVVLTYYDFRNDKDAGGELTDYWAEYCDTGKSNCLDPSNYTEIRLTNKSFDISQAPVARGYFLGDYEGLARSGASVQSVFSVVDSPGKNSIYGRSINFGSKAEVASASSR